MDTTGMKAPWWTFDDIERELRSLRVVEEWKEWVQVARCSTGGYVSRKRRLCMVAYVSRIHRFIRIIRCVFFFSKT